MKTWQTILRFVSRFRHQVSLPEDVATALGISLSNFLSVPEILETLCHPTCCPTRLMRLMTRQEAEAAFLQAPRVERFGRHTLCSYYFKDGWLEFVLQFDEQQQLRRLYIHHKHLPAEDGVEIPLRGHLRRPFSIPSQPRTHAI